MEAQIKCLALRFVSSSSLSDITIGVEFKNLFSDTSELLVVHVSDESSTNAILLILGGLLYIEECLICFLNANFVPRKINW